MKLIYIYNSPRAVVKIEHICAYNFCLSNSKTISGLTNTIQKL